MVANFDEKSALASGAMKAEMLDPEVEYDLAELGEIIEIVRHWID